MADKYYEDPLESLLDEQSDEDSCSPEIRDVYNHGARETQHGNLKTWTAADFSSIYVRFYPHLLRHAKRYLSNELQAEEVVQDAFLYVMTALPEIDTELGVLKFMKWKVKLLALDVIRASPNQREILVDSFDDELSVAVTDSEIERADDLAVVRAALAKLSPRHREALIATLYEEKSSAEVAAQMGLSDNAARQLVFRARSAFKKALVGEAEIAGKTVSEILSIAVKRASVNVRENVGKFGVSSVLLVFVISSLSWLPNNEPEEAMVAGIELDRGFEGPVVPSIPGESSLGNQLRSASPNEAVSPANKESSVLPESQVAEITQDTTQLSRSASNVDSSSSAEKREEIVSTGLDPLQGVSALSSSVGLTTGVFSSKPQALGLTTGDSLPSLGEYVVEILGPGDLRALISIDPSSLDILGAVIVAQTGDKATYGYPASFGFGSASSEGRSTKTLIARDVTFLNADNSVAQGPANLNANFAFSLEFDHQGNLMFGTFAVS